MPKISMNGYSFDGPSRLDVDELPAGPGVCLVCTESGYGIKVMSIEDAENMKECIANNKRRDCWKRVAEKDVVHIYTKIIENKEDRAKATLTIRSGRKYRIACEEDL
jgi:hypothetical protein